MLANDVSFLVLNVFLRRYRGKSCNLWQRENDNFHLSVRVCSAHLLSPLKAAGEERQLYDTSSIWVFTVRWESKGLSDGVDINEFDVQRHVNGTLGALRGLLMMAGGRKSK